MCLTQGKRIFSIHTARGNPRLLLGDCIWSSIAVSSRTTDRTTGGKCLGCAVDGGCLECGGNSAQFALAIAFRKGPNGVQGRLAVRRRLRLPATRVVDADA